MPNRPLYALITLLFVTLCLSHALTLGKAVYGDGIFYYSWVRSAVIDHDLQFANEYETMQVRQLPGENGAPGNKYSIGPALLWTPAFITMHTIMRGDGWSLPYQLSAALTSTLAALFGLALLARILGETKAVGYSIFIIATATNLLFYGAVDPVNSHAASFFAACVFISFLHTKRPNSLPVGAALGLISLMRLQDIVYGVLLIPAAKSLKWRDVLLGFSLVFGTQLLAWHSLYGNLMNPYLSGGESFSIKNIHLLGVLFGAQNGLLLWTPVVGIGWYGLMRSWRTYRFELIVIALSLITVASWSTWWQGASFSARMMVSTLPLVSLGIHRVVSAATRMNMLRPAIPMFAVALSIINSALILFYLVRT